MPHTSSVLSSWYRLIVKRASSSSKTLQRVWALILITTLLTVPVQPVVAASLEGKGIQTSKFALAISGKLAGLLLALGYQSDGMPDRPAAPERHEPKPPPTKAEREAKVHKLRLNVSNDMPIGSRQEIALGAIPL
ncbi:MAG TPA: hypothetical protein VJU84_00675, partial [Pyrinomonadaceae bacterium]|nr:hypothetical protein [Pyrinomonadaceae bacterium]